MKKILVTSDLSHRSDRAVERAVQLSQQHGAKITLLHVIDDELPATMIAQMRVAAQETLAAVLKSESAPESAEVVIKTGPIMDTIVAFAKDMDPDIVVLGTHKPRIFWDMFTGTTVERIVRALEHPVLLVSQPVTGPYQSILCGLDLSPSCLAAGRTAMSLSPDAKATTFHAVHVPYRGMLAPHASEKQTAPFFNDANNRLAQWWDENDIPEGMSKPEVSLTSVSLAFEQARTQSKADLVTLGAHGRTSLAPTFLGSFTEEQIRTPITDVLIVRD
jgi:nucleotide-binding universal stress UspA family protein